MHEFGLMKCSMYENALCCRKASSVECNRGVEDLVSLPSTGLGVVVRRRILEGFFV